MVWAQYALLALNLMGVGICLGRHGTSRRVSYGVADWLIAPAISLWLLYEAGAFSAIMG